MACKLPAWFFDNERKDREFLTFSFTGILLENILDAFSSPLKFLENFFKLRLD